MKSTNLFVMTAMVCGLGGVGCNEIFDNDYGAYPAGGTPSGQGGFGGSGSATGGSGANPQNMPCEPGTQQDCYSGPPETRGVGACTPGTWTCKPDGSGYGPCVGEKLPQEATCTDQDLDCNGQKDNYVPAPKIVSPAPDKAVPGGEVFFQWSGGVAPYQLEVAYDDKFENLVMIGNPPTPFSVETSGTTWLEELNGGFYHWRVRSANSCGASEYVNGSNVHVTCNPVVLRADPVSSFYQPSIAWNPKKNEYGIIMGRFDPGNAYIEFLRTDRQGKLIEGSIRTIPLMSSSEPNMNPDLIYIPSIENWGIITYSQRNDEATVATFNDEFTFYREMRIPLSSSNQTHRIAYDVGMDRVVTTTDHFGGAQETYLQHFDSTLSSMSSILDTGMSCNSDYNGQFAALVALSGFTEGKNSMFLSFDHRERSLNSWRHHLFVQRVDLNETSGNLAWPPGTDSGATCYAGMKIAEQTVLDVAFLSAAAWNPFQKNVGIAYALKNDDASADALTDAYFTIVDPNTGMTVLQEPLLLNSKAPKSAVPEMPEIAWDGNEFLVVWNDGRVMGGPRQLAMRKFDGTGKPIGNKDEEQIFSTTLDQNLHTTIPGWSGKSVIGHDQIHVIVGQQRADVASPSSVWMCIEPPYSN